MRRVYLIAALAAIIGSSAVWGQRTTGPSPIGGNVAVPPSSGTAAPTTTCSAKPSTHASGSNEVSKHGRKGDPGQTGKPGRAGRNGTTRIIRSSVGDPDAADEVTRGPYRGDPKRQEGLTRFLEAGRVATKGWVAQNFQPKQNNEPAASPAERRGEMPLALQIVIAALALAGVALGIIALARNSGGIGATIVGALGQAAGRQQSNAGEEMSFFAGGGTVSLRVTPSVERTTAATMPRYWEAQERQITAAAWAQSQTAVAQAWAARPQPAAPPPPPAPPAGLMAAPVINIPPINLVPLGVNQLAPAAPQGQAGPLVGPITLYGAPPGQQGQVAPAAAAGGAQQQPQGGGRQAQGQGQGQGNPPPPPAPTPPAAPAPPGP